jgi:hypothetical protein
MPQSDWNQRLEGTGNGGFAGLEFPHFKEDG